MMSSSSPALTRIMAMLALFGSGKFLPEYFFHSLNVCVTSEDIGLIIVVERICNQLGVAKPLWKSARRQVVKLLCSASGRN